MEKEEKREVRDGMKPGKRVGGPVPVAGVGNETKADMKGAFKMGGGGSPPRPQPVGQVSGKNPEVPIRNKMD